MFKNAQMFKRTKPKEEQGGDISTNKGGLHDELTQLNSPSSVQPGYPSPHGEINYSKRPERGESGFLRVENLNENKSHNLLVPSTNTVQKGSQLIGSSYILGDGGNQEHAKVMFNNNNTDQFDSEADFEDHMNTSKDKALKLMGKMMNSKTSEKSMMSGGLSYLKKLLVQRITPGFIKSINISGIFGVLVLLTLVIVLFGLFYPAVNTLKGLVEHSDFSNRMLAAYAIYAARLELNIMENENIFAVGVDVSDIDRETKELEHYAYGDFKEAYEFSFINGNLKSFASSVDTETYIFDLYGLENDDSEEKIGINFTHASTRVLTFMHEVENSEITELTRDNKFVKYFAQNFEEYFREYNSITQAFHDEIENRGTQAALKNFMITMLAISMVVNVVFMLILIPVYRHTENTQESGLSLLTRLEPKDIQKKRDLFAHSRNYMIGLSRHTFKAGAGRSSKSIISERSKRSEEFKKQQNSNRVRRYRGHRKQKVSYFVLFGIFASVFSIVITYFVVAEQRISAHLDHFVPLIKEYDIVADSNAFFNSFYFITYYSLNEWNEPNKGLYSHTNRDIVDKIEHKEVELMDFLTEELDQLLALDERFTSEYREKVPFMKDHDICLLLDEGMLESESIEECEVIFNGISKLGLPTTISRIYEIFENVFVAIENNQYSRDETIKIANDPDFFDIDKLMMYGDLILTTYMRIIRENLVNVLNNQQIEAYILLGVGIFVILLLYFFGWRNFVKKITKEYHLIKDVISILPLDLIYHNNYLKKFLRNNSKGE